MFANVGWLFEFVKNQWVSGYIPSLITSEYLSLILRTGKQTNVGLAYEIELDMNQGMHQCLSGYVLWCVRTINSNQ